MLETMMKAVLGITLIAGVWLTVEMAWRKVFAGTLDGKDPMSARPGCYGCCQSTCEAAGVENETSGDAAGKNQS